MKKKLIGEFLEFEKSGTREEGFKPSQVLMDLVDTDLHPSLSKTALRFVAGFFGAAAVTLSFCPQFGLGLFLVPDLIGQTLLQVGTWACAAYCATVFFGLSVFLIRALLTPDEWRVLAAHRPLWVFSLVGASATVFWIWGRAGEHALHFDQTFLIFWMGVGGLMLWMGLGRPERGPVSSKISIK